ncbi:excalibur calcium-binding domain-containing protein [Niallia taxi]|uniref:excalibur calcium-binding domain-containing protein n=1 Tax=Niallia taxi TaxID=2499688 RepID=UPI00119E52C5|nr:excalibur calcium-binding domain-containing protein [Niallia taxi]MCT2342925.1 excalibur calcium-binding domain-containing protein [Niallia taxi]MDE5051180.1 excalibur calcium-binding domain-containing protein [Niallia taxi]MED3964444.1 excalibur calcium-binding domain-containing protein [Niallia taxi]WOD62372.1 excalibur calcium-binding domain-containing protein [Niallia taxi]
MKTIIKATLATGLLFSFTLGTVHNAEAATKVVTYKNCTELNKKYKGGVARAANVKNKGGKTKYKPYVSKALYDANKKSDRDKDLIACEK